LEMVISADGTPIAYERRGDGPAVVLVGGALGDRREPTAAGLTIALAPCFTVFNYDRRGKGDSGDTRPYTVQREIEDLDAVIAKAGGQAFAFGGSSGGALALEAAVAGSSITRLAVFEPPYVTDHSRPPLPSQRVLSDLVDQGRWADAVELFMAKGADWPAASIARFKATPAWAGMEATAHTLAYEAAIVGEGPVPIGRFAAVRVPTLVLVGSMSSARMHGAAEVVADAVHGAELRSLAGQSHGQLDSSLLGNALTRFFST
jgi:hypothetical protein